MTKHYQMLLKQAREERGWSQKDVAQKIGTDAKTVSRWERGVASPSPYFRQRLQELYKKSLRELDLLSPSERGRADEGPSLPTPHASVLKVAEKYPGERANATDQSSAQPLAVNALAAQSIIPPTALQRHNRARMLGRLRHAYSELLAYSLQEIVWIELGLAEMPDAVQNATNRLVRLSGQATQILPPGTSILEVFETSERELLILGEPGAGKSTLLLHLAQALAQRAEQEDAHPIPVVLRLSSWAEQRPALEDWMSEQLALTYDVSQKLSVQWIRNDQVLPLLDGLDEMDAASRAACIDAINAYHREHLLVPLVVCSRRMEYEDVARHQKLALQHAVLIQPLTFEQVSAALEQIGQPLEALRQTLQTNQALQELTSTPLMLSILLLTYSRPPVSTLSHELSTLQGQVWTDYVARMTERKADSRRYSPRQTCSWLNWLARNLQTHYQTVFYLEQVEADWLPESLQQRAFRLTMRLPLILIGMVSSLLIGLFLQTVFDLTTGMQAALLGGFLGGCFGQAASASTVKDALSATQRKARGRHVGRGLLGVGMGLAIGVSFGFEVGPEYGWGVWVRDGLIYGSILGCVCWLLLALLPFVSSPHRFPHALKVPARLRSLLSTLRLHRTLLVAAGLGIGYGLSTGLSYGPGYGPGAGLNIGLSYACVTFPISVIVEKYAGGIRLTERLRWTWSGFLHGLLSFTHCVTSGALALGILLVVGLSYGLTVGLSFPLSTGLGFRLSYGLSDGLSPGLSVGPGTALLCGLIMGLVVGAGIGLGYWLGLGLFQSVGQEQLEDEDRQRLNQGVRRSARNSTIIGLFSGAVIGVLGFLGSWLSYGLNAAVSKGPGYGLDVGLSKGVGDALGVVWLFVIGGSLLGWAVSGGWAVLRHLALRWILHRKQIFPWQAQVFLDEATARILLRREGGGYSFIHRLLLEYFSHLDEEPV